VVAVKHITVVGCIADRRTLLPVTAGCSHTQTRTHVHTKTGCLNITLHYIRKLSKSNFKDYYGNAVIKQCLGKIAKINEVSAFEEML